MPAEKKKVNLVNLKTKFGVFLHNHYCCQVCYSIDKLAFGFTCEHKFCTKCNENHADQCKECNSRIESLSTNDGLFPYLEDLKEIMSIDMNRVANKLKQTNVQEVDSSKSKTAKKEEIEAVEKIGANKHVNSKREENKPKENDEPKTSRLERSESHNKSEGEHTPNRSSKRQAIKKANELKKNSSTKTSKDNAEPEKSVTRTRETSSRTKTLTDYIKESIKDKPESEPKEVEKAVTKSLRKADRSNKSVKQPSLVIIATSITENELRTLNRFAKRFNAKIVNDYCDEITHLVTLETKPDSRLTTRTLKYLKSLLSHKWLLDFKWIKESLSNDKLVDESDFELLGITKQSDDNLGAPKRSRENQDVNLFEGKKFYIDGKFGPKCGLPKNDYKELVKVGGGEVIESEKDVDDDTYIIIETSHMNKSKYKGRSNSLSTTDFLNCVSDFKFDL